MAMEPINGTSGNDTLEGTAADDEIFGLAGDDVLIGGSGGEDTLNGGDGSDTVSFEDFDLSLTIDLQNDEGNGVAQYNSGGSLILASLIDIENATGGNAADRIFGSDAANVLTGGAGDDDLFGQSGDDTLLGGAGNDDLQGGAGNDLMRGGAGDDIYLVGSEGDVVEELADEGVDTVQTTIVAQILAANFENLTFVGSGDFAGTGNTLDNVITGGSGSDTLRGDDGNDTLRGLTGSDELFGGAGDDTLYGGSGELDQLTGGEGADAYVGPLAELFGDSILDFEAIDEIRVEDDRITIDDVTVLAGAGNSTVLQFSADPDEAIGLSNFSSSGRLVVAGRDGDSVLTFEELLPELVEAQAIAGGANGIVNVDYLNGDTSSEFTVTLLESAAADNRNSLGVYEVDASGNIVDVRLLTPDVTAGGDFTVTGVEAGHKLGFFLIQDGANQLDADLLASATLGLSIEDGTVQLTNAGSVVANAVVVLSHDAALNPDNEVHVVSGAANDDSGSLQVGFEDLLAGDTGSDMDFQDVVFQVEAVPDAELLIA